MSNASSERKFYVPLRDPSLSPDGCSSMLR